MPGPGVQTVSEASQLPQLHGFPTALGAQSMTACAQWSEMSPGTFSGCLEQCASSRTLPVSSIPQYCRVEFLKAPEGRLSANSTCEGKVLATQSCQTLQFHGLSGSSVHGILQARILEWAAISFSRGIFLTQELNLGLRYCRQIPYQLSHQGSP